MRGVLEVDSTREAARASRIASWVLIAFGSVLALVSLSLRIFYQRNVARPLHRALDSARALASSRAGHVEAVQALAGGNLDHGFTPVPLPEVDMSGVAHDEAGDLLQSVAELAESQRSFDEAFAKMTEALRSSNLAERERDWLKSSQNELNTVMRGEQDLAVLSQRLLDFLARLLGARVGALYVDEGQGAGVCLLAGYGLVLERHPQRVVAGEGLAGQAIRDGKRVLVGAAPPGLPGNQFGPGQRGAVRGAGDAFAAWAQYGGGDGAGRLPRVQRERAGLRRPEPGGHGDRAGSEYHPPAHGRLAGGNGAAGGGIAGAAGRAPAKQFGAGGARRSAGTAARGNPARQRL
ncbi:GAF domain-containing protein [Pseudoduganella violaceinigra]|uniref:GAF domain-containing protein n=1 Tax=Pseudoduganella violaceinigra TaxID=246602 RepID=UPI001E548B79|nr:GAF domain-containing protein [Pseudoduganella violaceinigra]